MVSLPRGSVPKLLAAVSFSLLVFIVIHQVSFANDLSHTNQPIHALTECPSDTKPHWPSNKSIPKIVHQIWKTTNVSTYPAVPSHAGWTTKFEPLNYTVKLWTDTDILALVAANYTWLLPTYTGYAQNIQRADLARLIVVHSEGGIYADLDVHPRSAEAVSCFQNIGLQAVFAPTGGSAGVSNHFFMAEQGSEFLMWALQEAKRRGGARSDRILLPYLRVFWSTGPLMLTSAFRQYMWMYGGLPPQVALLGENLTRTMVGHAAGRSWHGSDGRFLNYVSDHIDILWVVIVCLGVMLGFVCAFKRCRWERTGMLRLGSICRGRRRYSEV